jgi:hypothetical protein
MSEAQGLTLQHIWVSNIHSCTQGYKDIQLLMVYFERGRDFKDIHAMPQL